jgi:hypothetical protein
MICSIACVHLSLHQHPFAGGAIVGRKADSEVAIWWQFDDWSHGNSRWSAPKKPGRFNLLKFVQLAIYGGLAHLQPDFLRNIPQPGARVSLN